MFAVIEFVGTIILASMLTLTVFKMKFDTQQSLFKSKLMLYMQSNSAIFGQVLRNDLKDAGYNITDIYKCIKSIDEKSISYTADMDNNGVPELTVIAVENYSGDDPTVNPFDKKIVKYTDGVPEVYDIKGVTDFKFTYFDKNMQETSVTSEVKIIDFKYKLLSDEPVDYRSGINDSSKYAMVIGEEKVFLKNIWDW
ncbi:MAG: hypothetical protein CSB55_04535 [Candidatus Cloacimonadota bacterium]|nr:MAG: hypothetical protein CSB55_04535 [Candidatus Cloacimonadota bacterium]